MTERRKTAGRRRLRSVRLRPETTAGDRLGAMTQHLSSMLGIRPEEAKKLLLRLGHSKPRAA